MNSFEDTIQRLYGKQGSYWLRHLPEKIHAIAEKHYLSALKPLSNLSYHYVLAGFQGQQPIILKLAYNADSLKKEASALKAFNGFGAAQVLANEPGWLITTRAIPGNSLKTYFPKRDETAVTIVCEAIQRLHQASIPPATFLTIQDWLLALDQEWEISPDDLHQARQLRDHLLATAAMPVLLHGDLHHENLLQNGDEWLVIDPKGVIGEPIFDVSAFLRNPIPELLQHPEAVAFIQLRVERFADIMGYSRLRIVQWCFVQAVLAQAWALEDNLHHHVAYFKQLTDFFRGLLRV